MPWFFLQAPKITTSFLPSRKNAKLATIFLHSRVWFPFSCKSWHKTNQKDNPLSLGGEGEIGLRLPEGKPTNQTIKRKPGALVFLICPRTRGWRQQILLIDSCHLSARKVFASPSSLLLLLITSLIDKNRRTTKRKTQHQTNTYTLKINEQLSLSLFLLSSPPA